MYYPSSLIEEAVNRIARLPGIGRKSALRLALHLLAKDAEETQFLAEALLRMRQDKLYCKRCSNISDAELCVVCANPLRDSSIICVVEGVREVMAIENTGQFRGVYHVLGGLISPVNGIGPDELRMEQLFVRVQMPETEALKPKELILALSSTIEGDTTAFYIQRKLKAANLRITTPSKGIPLGSELEYTDEITLGRSLTLRTELN
jgi:recombination protein RecR